MAHIHSIKKLLNIKDPNIILDEVSVKNEKKDDVECVFIDGKLTYQPIGCTVCGIKNESHQDIIKNGSKLSTIKLTHINFQPVILRSTIVKLSATIH